MCDTRIDFSCDEEPWLQLSELSLATSKCQNRRESRFSHFCVEQCGDRSELGDLGGWGAKDPVSSQAEIHNMFLLPS